MTDPFWSWCPAPGASRQTQLTVDTNAYGDGYVQRATRGLNPAKPTWDLVFPFASFDHLEEMDAFLLTNAVQGFYFTPPDASAEVFVYCDAWAASIADKNGASGIVGQLQATFVRCFNPQPL